MEIFDISQPIESIGDHEAVLVKSSFDSEIIAEDVLTEHFLRVYINGTLTMKIVCSPDNLVELIIGRLISENMISNIDQIEEIELCEYSTRVLVYLKDRQMNIAATHVETVPSCCTNNKILNGYFLQNEQPEKVKPISWSAQDIFILTQVFSKGSPMHKTTKGAHSCYLAKQDKILFCCEDIGRHNALDKVIGKALKAGIDLQECTIFTSGRVPTDMITKVLRAKIPIMVSKAVPTNLAVSLARTYDLTLICSAYPDSIRVFSCPLVGNNKCD